MAEFPVCAEAILNTHVTCDQAVEFFNVNLLVRKFTGWVLKVNSQMSACTAQWYMKKWLPKYYSLLNSHIGRGITTKSFGGMCIKNKTQMLNNTILNV